MATHAAVRAKPSRRLRGPNPLVAFRYLAAGRLDGAPEFMLDIARRYGTVARFNVAGTNFYAVAEPELVREILVTKARSFVKSRGIERMRPLLGDGLLTSEEPLHLRQRRLVQPAFHRDRIANYGQTMVSYALRTADSWQAGDVVNVVAAMMRLTLSIAGKTLFDADVESEADTIGRALNTTMEIFPLLLQPFSEWRDKLPLPSTRRFNAARETLASTIDAMIASRRREGVDRGDVLSMLIESRDDDGSRMDDKQIRDECLTILLAGYETTAVALSWTWYVLSQHPLARQRLGDELHSVLGERDATSEDFPRLAYTTAVVKESMRLYPPAWIVGRRAVDDVAIGDVAIRAGEVTLMSPFAVHRDPRYYDEPLAFRPERWLVERELPKFAYFPFGGGNRVCIGESFAWMEAVLVLATIARRWAMTLEPGTPVATAPSVTLRPKYPMPMRLSRVS